MLVFCYSGIRVTPLFKQIKACLWLVGTFRFYANIDVWIWPLVNTCQTLTSVRRRGGGKRTDLFDFYCKVLKVCCESYVILNNKHKTYKVWQRIKQRSKSFLNLSLCLYIWRIIAFSWNSFFFCRHICRVKPRKETKKSQQYRELLRIL